MNTITLSRISQAIFLILLSSFATYFIYFSTKYFDYFEKQETLNSAEVIRSSERIEVGVYGVDLKHKNLTKLLTENNIFVKSTEKLEEAEIALIESSNFKETQKELERLNFKFLICLRLDSCLFYNKKTDKHLYSEIVLNFLLKTHPNFPTVEHFNNQLYSENKIEKIVDSDIQISKDFILTPEQFYSENSILKKEIQSISYIELFFHSLFLVCIILLVISLFKQIKYILKFGDSGEETFNILIILVGLGILFSLVYYLNPFYFYFKEPKRFFNS